MGGKEKARAIQEARRRARGILASDEFSKASALFERELRNDLRQRLGPLIERSWLSGMLEEQVQAGLRGWRGPLGVLVVNAMQAGNERDCEALTRYLAQVYAFHVQELLVRDSIASDRATEAGENSHDALTVPRALEGAEAHLQTALDLDPDAVEAHARLVGQLRHMRVLQEQRPDGRPSKRPALKRMAQDLYAAFGAEIEPHLSELLRLVSRELLGETLTAEQARHLWSNEKSIVRRGSSVASQPPRIVRSARHNERFDIETESGQVLQSGLDRQQAQDWMAEWERGLRGRSRP